MNIPTSNGMGLKPTGMQLKASNGMGIKTRNGMGISNSKGMGLSSEDNYFKFDEYQRTRNYLFGDRGRGRKSKPEKPKPAPKSALKKPSTQTTGNTEKPKDRELHQPTIKTRKSVQIVSPQSTSPLPTLPGNSLNSMKRMLKMFG